jgi:hypothetical protein
VGIVAAAALVAVSGALVLLLSLIPSRALTVALGVRNFPDEDIDASARGARSFLSPWFAQASGESEGFGFSYTTITPLATLVLVLVLIAVGLVVRRVTPRTTRARTTALISCAITAATLVAILALTLGFEIESGAFAAEYSFSGGAYFLAALAEVLLVGAFSFGVVGRWREPFRTAARTAGLAYASIFVVGTVLFPFWLVAHDPAGPADPQRARDLALSTSFAPGMGSAALPLALGAKIHLQTEEFQTPFTYPDEDASYTYVPGLAKYTETHDSARLGGYSGAGGIGWKLFVILGAVFLILFWAAAAARAVRSLGASRSFDGLRLGALVGVFAIPLVLIVSPLAAVRLETSFEGEQDAVFWGVPGAASVQAAFELLVLTAVAGAVYAALKPSPPRYAVPRFVVPSWLWPPDEAESAAVVSPAASPQDREPLRAAFCERCGARFESPDADFCGRCGAPRGRSSRQRGSSAV